MASDVNKLEWKNITGVLQRGFSERVREVLGRHSRITNRSNGSEQEVDEGINPELKKVLRAYLAGVMYGDGTIGRGTIRFRRGYKFNDYRVKLAVADKDFITLYMDVLTCLGLSCQVHHYQKKPTTKNRLMYEAVSQDKKTYDYFIELRKPDYVKNMGEVELVAFLKGVFDSDGSVQNNRVGLNISKSAEHEATPLIKHALDTLNIKHKYYSYGARIGRVVHEGVFNISSDESIYLYDLFGGLSIHRKDKKFLELVKNRKDRNFWKDEQLDLLDKLLRAGLDYSMIAKKLNRSKSAIAHKVSRKNKSKEAK